MSKASLVSPVSLACVLCPRSAARTPGTHQCLGKRPAVRREETWGCRAESPSDLAVPTCRELRGAPAARVRCSQSPDPGTARSGAGAAREGPVSLQLELLRPALWQEAGGAGSAGNTSSAGLSTGRGVDCSPSPPACRAGARYFWTVAIKQCCCLTACNSSALL